MTDSVINSQTQSPLIRILAAVDSAAGNFTQHVPDNVPPVSNTEVELDPVGSWSFGQQARFQLPQLGYIDSIELIFRWARADGLPGGRDLVTPMYNTAYELFQRAALQTRRRDLERVDAIHASTKPLRSSLAEAIKIGYDTAFHSVSPVNGSWRRYVRDSSGTAYDIAEESESPLYEARCPLDFSILQSPAIQLQSLFTESLEIAVDTRPLYGGQMAIFQQPSALMAAWSTALDAVAGDFNLDVSSCRLRIRYRNFHDETENVIRNENYVSGTPATILAANIFTETPQPLTPPTSLNRAAVAALTLEEFSTALNAVTSPVTVTNTLQSKNLAYAITFALAPNQGGLTTYCLGYRCTGARLVANGQTLQAWSDEDLQRSLRQSFLKTLTPYGCNDLAGYAASNKRTVGDGFGVHPQAYTIQMGMQYGRMFNTGALGLSSLSSVQLQTDWVIDLPVMMRFNVIHSELGGIEDVVDFARSRAGLLWDSCEVAVWVEHFQLLRTDPDNGALSVSLDI